MSLREGVKTLTFCGNVFVVEIFIKVRALTFTCVLRVQHWCTLCTVTGLLYRYGPVYGLYMVPTLYWSSFTTPSLEIQ